MAKVVIFGMKDLASLAHYYLKVDSEHEVVAFSVDREFIKENSFEGLPVVPFEDLPAHFAPNTHSLFVPMTQVKMGKVREEKYLKGKAMGYGYISYISSKATVWDRAAIGENCFIFEDNTIQPFVRIGNNNILWSGNHIGHHSVIGDHVFITSHVVISGHVNIGSYSFFGVNATIRDGIEIAEETFIGMGANITRSTERQGVYLVESTKKNVLTSDKLRGL